MPYIVKVNDKDYLKQLLKEIENFLTNELGLTLNKNKTKFIDVRYGIDFLGAYVKPYRTYISNKSLKKIKRHLFNEKPKDANSINSFLGTLRHYNSFNIREKIFSKVKPKSKGFFNSNYTKYIEYDKLTFSNKNTYYK